MTNEIWRGLAAVAAATLLGLAACGDDGSALTDEAAEQPDAGAALPDGDTTAPDAGTPEPDVVTTDPDGVTEELDSGAVAPDGGEDATDSGSAEPDSGGGESDGETACVDDETFFAEQVYAQVLEPACMACHTSEGLARDSELVLIGPVQPNYLAANREALSEVASLEQGGTSIVLLKPLGELGHGGGAVLAPEDRELEILRGFLDRLGSPVVCADGGDSDAGATGLGVLDESSVFRKGALLLGGRLPTSVELDDLAAGGERALAELLRELTYEEEFYERVEEMFNDQLLSERYLDYQSALSLLDASEYPARYWYQGIGDAEGTARTRTNRAMAREPLELVSWIIRNDRPFSEILTADYTVVNDYTAMSWGLEGATMPDLNDPTAEEFRQVQVPGWQHAGVLSTPVFVNRFPTTPTNRNRHRSRIFFDRFLATDILAFAERPSDPTLSSYHNATLNDPQCTVCHATMDPVAGLFQNFDESGHLNPPTNGWYPDLAQPGFGRETLPQEDRANPLQWLAARTVDDPRFALAMTHIVYEGLTGSEPLRPVTDPLALDARAAYGAQRSQFDRIATRFIDSDFDFRGLVVDMVMSDLFRAVIPGEAEPAMAEAAGAMHFLTPEELDRKIEAVLGIPWRSRWDRPTFLSTDYRLLFGGIDSNGTTQRLRAPNGIMVNIADRMATEMACRAVSFDFVLQPESRRLFPLVEPTFVPTTEEGFVIPEAVERLRQNVQHLHRHILGEELELSDPEIEATYQLFLTLWQEGEAAVDAGQVSALLPGTCQANNDPFTNQGFPTERRITRDEQYTIRAWMGVVSYLLTDYRFLHE